MPKLIIAAMLLMTVFICLTSCEKNKQKLIVTAHRGASGLAPENTMSSILKAREIGADFSEMDVQETSDGVIILLHDNTLERTAGLEKNIWEMDYASLNGIDVGSWFNPEFKDEPIPTLEAIIDSVKGKMKLNIELKMNGHEQKLEERVLDIVMKKGFQNNCILTSFKFSAIDKVRELNPDLKVGYIFSKMPENVDVFTANVDLLSVKYKLVDEDFVKKAHANNKEVHVWTVNEPEEMQRLIDLGVDSIITNRPDILLEVVNKN